MCGCRFPMVLHIPNGSLSSHKSPTRLVNSCQYCRAISGYFERLLGREKGVFDAAKPADWKVESPREKSRKRQIKKPLIKRSVERLRDPHRPVDKARPKPRLDRERTPLKRQRKTSSRALEQDGWNTRISGGEKPFNSARKDP